MSSARILLVEDNPVDQSIVTAALTKYQVTKAGTVADANTALARELFDLVILDINLPDGNGFEFLKELKSLARLRQLPIVFLTNLSEVPARVQGLNLGAQDYICKPVDPSELCARVDARLRLGGRAVGGEIFLKGDLQFNLGMRQLFIVSGSEPPRQINLTTLEFNVLFHLAHHFDVPLSREQLLEAAWSQKDEVSDRSVDSLISGLRKKISSSQYQIKAVYGSGYRLERRATSSRPETPANKGSQN